MILRMLTYDDKLLPMAFVSIPPKGAKIQMDYDDVYVVDDIVFRYVNGIDDICDVYVIKYDGKLLPKFIERPV